MNRIRVAIGTGLTVASIAIMGLTNPKADDYLEYATSNIPETYCLDTLDISPVEEHSFADDMINALCSGHVWRLLTRKPLLQFFMEPAFASGSRYVIETSSQHRSYLLFSVHTTELPGRTYRSIGVLGQFIDFH